MRSKIIIYSVLSKIDIKSNKDYIHENLNVPVLLAANVTGMVINQILN